MCIACLFDSYRLYCGHLFLIRQAVLGSPATTQVHISALNHMCTVELAAKEYDNVETYCLRILEMRPDHDEALSLRAWAVCLKQLPSLASPPALEIALLPPALAQGIFNTSNGDLQQIGLDSRRAIDASRGMLQRCIEIAPTSSLHRLRLGKVLWAMGGAFRTDKQYAFASFLTAAKLNSTQPDAFCYLGHYYMAVERNSQSAVRCYNKALNLDVSHGPSRMHL
jgi:hypothetical protein